MVQSPAHRCRWVNPVAPKKEFLTADGADNTDWKEEAGKREKFTSFIRVIRAIRG
jgi:hypothetical protein